jgi:DNA-binding transcriptional MerR regulator
MSMDAEAGLTIGAVAARTGLSVPVLRAWDHRYGSPQPARLHGGHRRYGDDDVARILRVVAEREAGRSLEAAIRIAARGPEQPPLGDEVSSGTIYAGLRRRRPDLEVHVLSRRAMLAVSHAIEDECLAQADHPTVTGAFQRVSAYERALPRWRELGRTAASTTVFADFARSRTHAGVHEIAINDRAAISREWAVVCDGPGAAAALAGWERSDGRFEALWSLEPAVVRLATEVGRQLAREHAPRVRVAAAPIAPTDLTGAVRRSAAVTNRAIAYLDR